MFFTFGIWTGDTFSRVERSIHTVILLAYFKPFCRLIQGVLDLHRFGLKYESQRNTIAWQLLQINPFNTKVSAAKHICVLNLSFCYPKIKNETIFSYIIFWIMLMNAMPIFYRKWPLTASDNQCPWKQYENQWYSLPYCNSLNWFLSTKVNDRNPWTLFTVQ